MIQIEYLPTNYYDAIVIRYDGNDGIFHNILIDGGDYRNATLCYKDNIKPRLQQIFNAGEVIDLWIITHIDDDHIGGIKYFAYKKLNKDLQIISHPLTFNKKIKKIVED